LVVGTDIVKCPKQVRATVLLAPMVDLRSVRSLSGTDVTPLVCPLADGREGAQGVCAAGGLDQTHDGRDALLAWSAAGFPIDARACAELACA